jgi:hypothetical protein
MLMSFAAYRAMWQLVTRPHHWEKTPHGAVSTAVVSADVAAETPRAV